MCCRLIPTVGSTLRARCAKRRRKRVSAKSARPVFEHTELFLRGVGDTTDIVQKEMYTFKDKGDRSITLKPEGTAGAARCLLENNLYADTLPCKMYYLNAPIFRYEAPQSGRLREPSPVRSGMLRRTGCFGGRGADFAGCTVC